MADQTTDRADEPARATSIDGSGKDLTSTPRTIEPEQEVPVAGESQYGPRDPLERAGDAGDASLHDGPRAEEVLEEQTSHYGAGKAEPDELAAGAAPFSSSMYPASSEATPLTHQGDQVTGLEDGPEHGLGRPTTGTGSVSS